MNSDLRVRIHAELITVPGLPGPTAMQIAQRIGRPPGFVYRELQAMARSSIVMATQRGEGQPMRWTLARRCTR